jgi:hypothetical protein
MVVLLYTEVIPRVKWKSLPFHPRNWCISLAKQVEWIRRFYAPDIRFKHKQLIRIYVLSVHQFSYYIAILLEFFH